MLSAIFMKAPRASDEPEILAEVSANLVETTQDLIPAPPRACPVGMKRVEGTFCPDIARRCLRPTDDDRECLEFSPARCMTPPERRIPKSYCMDVFEFPNREGELPLVAQTFIQAKAACAAQNKRVCTKVEWTFACEGPELLAYPYGNRHDATKCHIDDPQFRRGLVLVEASGSRPLCVSSTGIFDMTGNADEWVRNEHYRPESRGRGQNPWSSALKGGHWGPVRNQCRPTTTSHYETFANYETGFRCCSDGE